MYLKLPWVIYDSISGRNQSTIKPTLNHPRIYFSRDRTPSKNENRDTQFILENPNRGKPWELSLHKIIYSRMCTITSVSFNLLSLLQEYQISLAPS